MKTVFKLLLVFLILSLITATYSGCMSLPQEKGIGLAMVFILIIWTIPSKHLYNNVKERIEALRKAVVIVSSLLNAPGNTNT